MNSFNKTLDNNELAIYLTKQLNNTFPDNNIITVETVYTVITSAEPKIYKCFKGVKKKYFNENGIVEFNHLISDQYAMFLYLISHEAYLSQNIDLATKVYYLNKNLHAIDVFYTSILPDIFLFVHPLGSILGRATFSDNFVMYQNCTVGCLNDGIFPTFKGDCIMYSNSSILGKSIIGHNVCIAAGVSVVNTNIPDNSIVFGEYPNYTIKQNNISIFKRPPFLYK